MVLCSKTNIPSPSDIPFFIKMGLNRLGTLLWNYPCDLPTYSTPSVERSAVAPGNPNSYSCFKDSTPGRKRGSGFLVQYFLDSTSNLSPARVRNNLGCKCLWIFLFYIFSEGGDWKSTWCSFHSRYLTPEHLMLGYIQLIIYPQISGLTIAPC